MTSRILLADDSITIQKVVNLTFADEDIEVVSVSNGEAAERQLGEINPDLVLADIFMPGKNGYELCEYIKESPEFNHVPVVLLVGAFEPFDQSEARRVRADAHLTKPFETRTLVETVRNLISLSNKPDTESLVSEPLPDAVGEDDESFRPLPGSGPRSSPAFNIDLSAMTDQWDSAETTAPSEPTSLNEASGSETTPSGQSEAVSSSPFESGLMDSSSPDQQMGDTIELSSLSAEETPPSPDAFADTMSIEVPDQPPPADVEAPSSSAEGLFGQDESPAWERAEPSAPLEFDSGAPDMAVDFDKAADAESTGFNDFLSFDVDAVSPPDEAGAGADYFAEADLDQQMPEAPPTQALDVTGLSLDQKQPERQTAGDAELGDPDLPMPSAATASLLSAEEPLGDLLEVDRADEKGESEDDLEEGAAISFEQPSTSEELTFEPRAEGVKGSLETESQSLMTDAPLDLEDSFSISPITDEQQNQTFSTGDTVSPVEYSFTSDAPEGSDAAFEIAEPDVAAPSQDLTAEDAGSSNFDFKVVAEDEEETSHADALETDEPFTSSEMWSEEEAHFRPIDIEEVPVDEGESSAHSETESGYEFTAPATINVSSESLPASETETPRDESDWQAVELPPEVVEEIVRRVVAQISESVVREIAWEVVPDCVERVVEKLTREEVAKRM